MKSLLPKVTFYLLDNSLEQGLLTAPEALACDLARVYWRQGHKILIACENMPQARVLDDALWVRHPDSFVPHALVGEETPLPAPIAISWGCQLQPTTDDLLISLLFEKPAFADHFSQVLEFVPCDPLLKRRARERYSAYRAAKFELTTATPPIFQT